MYLCYFIISAFECDVRKGRLVLYTLGSKALPAAQLAMFSLAEVLLAPLWVWLFLGETISVNTLYCGLVLLSAIVFNAILVSKNKGIDCG